MTSSFSRPQPAPAKPAGDLSASVLEAVGTALAGLRYGEIQLTVHDGRVVQLEVTEKQRFG
jgi:hypothetical protein